VADSFGRLTNFLSTPSRRGYEREKLLRKKGQPDCLIERPKRSPQHLVEYMKNYKLDKTAFATMSFEEADNKNLFDKNVNYQERLEQVYYLIAQAYGFLGEKPPKFDKTYFNCRKLGE
jgi:hypothetical protein